MVSWERMAHVEANPSSSADSRKQPDARALLQRRARVLKRLREMANVSQHSVLFRIEGEILSRGTQELPGSHGTRRKMLLPL